MKYLVEVRKYHQLQEGDETIGITIDDSEEFSEPAVVIRINRVVRITPYTPEDPQKESWVEIQYAGEEAFQAHDHYETLVILGRIE